MPVPQIEQVRGLGDFATTYHWALEIATPPPAIAGIIGRDGLNLRCSSSDVPKSTNQAIQINVRGHKIKQHGIGDHTQQITLELNETIDNYISNVIRSWREACHNVRDGSQLTRAEVQGVFLLQRYDGTRKNIIWTYKLIGVFLEDYDIPQLNGESDTLKPTITLSYDYFLDNQGSNVV